MFDLPRTNYPHEVEPIYLKTLVTRVTATEPTHFNTFLTQISAPGHPNPAPMPTHHDAFSWDSTTQIVPTTYTPNPTISSTSIYTSWPMATGTATASPTQAP